MHQLIVGQTLSGKTTVARQLAKRYRANRIGVLVLDPIGDDWPADLVSTDASAYMDIVKRSTRCALFIDESGESIGHYNDEMFWLATRARHYGHKSHFITQRANQISPTVRTQCSGLFLFNSSFDDAKLLANEYNKDELRKANQLKQYEYFHTKRFAEVTRNKTRLT